MSEAKEETIKDAKAETTKDTKAETTKDTKAETIKESTTDASNEGRVTAEDRLRDPKLQQEPYMSKDSNKGAPSLRKFGSDIGGQLRSFLVSTKSIFEGKKKNKTAEEIEAEEKVKRELKAKEEAEKKTANTSEVVEKKEDVKVGEEKNAAVQEKQPAIATQ